MEQAKKALIAVESDATVNEVIERSPETLRIFGAWGIDSCCGGGLRLETVAERHGLDLDRLLVELTAAAAGAATGG